jgi:hypothetical protein
MRDWLERPGEPASDLDIVVLLLNSLDLLEDFVGASVRKRFAAAASLSPADFFSNSDHQLTTAAQIARDKFLATELGLSG